MLIVKDRERLKFQSIVSGNVPLDLMLYLYFSR
jgi:hypothetical protein